MGTADASLPFFGAASGAGAASNPFHCEASAVRAAAAGTVLPEPVTSGRGRECGNTEALPGATADLLRSTAEVAGERDEPVLTGESDLMSLRAGDQDVPLDQAIRLRRGNQVVAHATVKKDGSFETTAPLPARSLRASHTKANTLRYRAEIGKEKSLPLKLLRRLTVSSLTSKDGYVTVTGRVSRPLTTPVSDVRLVHRVSCHEVVLVKRFLPNPDGSFRVTAKAPKNDGAAVYRLATRVREKASNPRSYPTLTLPRGVALETR